MQEAESRKGGGHSPSQDRLTAWKRPFQPGLRWGLLWGRGAFALLVFLWPCVVWAQTGEPRLEVGDSQAYPGEAVEEVPFQGDIGLDQLLQLPTDGVYGGDVRQAANARTWRRRFAEAAIAVTQAQSRIEEARSSLDEMSAGGGASQWQMAPPGSNASAEVAPMSLKHREAIRAGKEELDEAERNQRALVIEADLAGVPESWRVPLGAND